MAFNPAHLHLILNHIPILGAAFVALILATGLLRRSASLQRFGLALTVALALVAGPVYLTGEPAEEHLEHLPGFDETLVDQHEERAEAGLVSLLATGALAVAALWLARGERGPTNRWVSVVFAALLASFALLAWAAEAGGRIRHPELRPGVPTTSPAPEESD